MLYLQGKEKKISFFSLSYLTRALSVILPIIGDMGQQLQLKSFY